MLGSKITKYLSFLKQQICFLEICITFLSKSCKVPAKKSIEELSLMTLKTDAKFKENMTCGFKHSMRNMVKFYPTTQKSTNFTSIGSFCRKAYNVSARKFQRNYVMTQKGDAKFKGKLLGA